MTSGLDPFGHGFFRGLSETALSSGKELNQDGRC